MSHVLGVERDRVMSGAKDVQRLSPLNISEVPPRCGGGRMTHLSRIDYLAAMARVLGFTVDWLCGLSERGGSRGAQAANAWEGIALSIGHQYLGPQRSRKSPETGAQTSGDSRVPRGQNPLSGNEFPLSDNDFADPVLLLMGFRGSRVQIPPSRLVRPYVASNCDAGPFASL